MGGAVDDDMQWGDPDDSDAWESDGEGHNRSGSRFPARSWVNRFLKRRSEPLVLVV